MVIIPEDSESVSGPHKRNRRIKESPPTFLSIISKNEQKKGIARFAEPEGVVLAEKIIIKKKIRSKRGDWPKKIIRKISAFRKSSFQPGAIVNPPLQDFSREVAPPFQLSAGPSATRWMALSRIAFPGRNIIQKLDRFLADSKNPGSAFRPIDLGIFFH